MKSEPTFKCTCGRTVTKTPAHIADTFCSASHSRSFMKGNAMRDAFLARRYSAIRASRSVTTGSPDHAVTPDWLTVGGAYGDKLESGKTVGVFVERNQAGEERFVISRV